MRRREFLTRLGYVAGAAAGVQAGLVLLGSSRNRAMPELGTQHGLQTASVASETHAPAAASVATAAQDFAPAGAAVRQLFGRLVPGSRIGRWTLVSVSDVRMGSIAVLLRDRHGETFQVDITRRESGLIATRGVANTPSLSLFLANGGDGRTQTVEEHGLGAMALASALSRREMLGARVPELLTLRERNAHHQGGAYTMIG